MHIYRYTYEHTEQHNYDFSISLQLYLCIGAFKMSCAKQIGASLFLLQPLTLTN